MSYNNLKTLVIINPNSGPLHRRRAVSRIVKILEEAFPSLETAFTRKSGDASDIVKRALARGVALVLCAGGDGTVSETAGALIGTSVLLGVIPTGTGNGLAREIGLSLNPFKALHQILAGKTVPVFPGDMNGGKFLLVSGAGFEAFISDLTDRCYPVLKRRTGYLSYILVAIFKGYRYPFFPMKISLNGTARKGYGLLVLKSSVRIGPLTLAPAVSLKKEGLGAFIFTQKGLFPIVKFLLAFLFGLQHNLTGVPFYPCDEVHAESEFPVPTQMDGETSSPVPATWKKTDRPLLLIYPP